MSAQDCSPGCFPIQMNEQSYSRIKIKLNSIQGKFHSLGLPTLKTSSPLHRSCQFQSWHKDYSQTKGSNTHHLLKWKAFAGISYIFMTTHQRCVPKGWCYASRHYNMKKNIQKTKRQHKWYQTYLFLTNYMYVTMTNFIAVKTWLF